MTNLNSRLRKMESSHQQPADKETYIKALILRLSGEDDGDSLTKLPPVTNKKDGIVFLIHAVHRMVMNKIPFTKEIQDRLDKQLRTHRVVREGC